MARILVTGATGSLGSNVITEAARRGLEVRARSCAILSEFTAPAA